MVLRVYRGDYSKSIIKYAIKEAGNGGIFGQFETGPAGGSAVFPACRPINVSDEISRLRSDAFCAIISHNILRTGLRRDGRREKEMNMKMNIQNHNSYLLVDLNVIRRNARVILGGLKPGTELIPVLKDDAYGLGLVPVTEALCSLPEIRRIALAHVSEGLELRAAGIDRELLVMGAALPFQMEAAAEAELTLACPRPGFLTAYCEAAERVGKRARVQIKIDTGLHRIGLEREELDGLLEELCACGKKAEITGAFSHFSDVTDSALCEREYAAFLEAAEKLRAGGMEIPMLHMACSASSERRPRYNLDAVRCGRRLYMDRPGVSGGAITEAVSWRSFVTQVKSRRAGERIGYGGAVTLKRDSLVATVGVGYGDGLNQGLFGVGAPVLLNGKRCRLLACCMDQCMVDATGLDCRVGDEVTFFGYDGNGGFLSSQEIAALVNDDEGCGLTSALSDRVARVYTTIP